MKKRCEYCKKEFDNKRSDAKFCSSTCKARQWDKNSNNNNNKSTNANINVNAKESNLQTTLKGVVGEKETRENIQEVKAPVTYEYKVETSQHIALKNKLNKLLVLKAQVEKKMLTLKEEIISLKKIRSEDSALYCAGLGAMLADTSFRKPINNILGAAGGFLLGKLFDTETKEEKEAKRQKQIFQNTAEIKRLDSYMTSVLNDITTLRAEISSTKQYEVKQAIIPEKHSNNALSGILCLKDVSIEQVFNKKNSEKNDAPEQANVVNMTSKQTSETSKPFVSNEKIITSQQLAKYNYKALDFQGRWLEFIGQPSTTFHCAIHGKAGEGKSTFAIQFANYLANNFGKVVYISGEEGFSKTIKDKFVNNNALSKNLFVANLRNSDDIKKEIGVDDFHFIFIDSLSNMRIDAENLKQLRERYKNSALITILQATKDGNMRGSYVIIHDADIEVKVTNGLAVTHKNRFKEKHKEFKVF